MSLLLCQVCKITRIFYLFFIVKKNYALNSRLRLKVSAFFRDNGLKAIENLMEKKGKFDYILLETTGLADPGMTHFVTEI